MSLFNPLVIASHNAGKVKEIHELLAPYSVEVVSAATLGLPEPEETGATFEANAALKSVAAAAGSGHWALADDSGLCVEGLGGEPGIYSARLAGPHKDFKMASERIRKDLEKKGINSHGAKAYFICVLSLSSPKGETVTFEGRVDGALIFPPRGAKGFGYDPIFIPEGHTKTFAEMEPKAKHAMSHRARAFEKFLQHVKMTSQSEAV